MNSQLQINHSTSAQPLPNHNSFWHMVLNQDNPRSHQIEGPEATAEDCEEAIWQPIRYQLKLGLRGWIVLPRVVAPAAMPDNSSSMSTDDDRHSTNPHPNQESEAHADSISEISRDSDSTSSDQNEGLLSLFRHLRNAQIDESQQGLLEGLEILYSRLHPSRFGIFQIGTSSSVLKATFSRQNLTCIYGGSPMDTFSTIDKNKGMGKYSRFMCLNLLYNPYGPQYPGAPGLFFALRDPSRWPKEKEIVIVRYGANEWNLMGRYAIKRCAPLSGEEFSSLNENVQQTWLNNIWSHKWGDFTLAAIYLRRTRGREPTDDEIDLFAKTRISIVRRKVLMEDVKQAFWNSQENINVWTMKCIGYDKTFKRRLVPEAGRAHGQAAAKQTPITQYNLRSVKRKRSGGSKVGKTATKKTHSKSKRRRF